MLKTEECETEVLVFAFYSVPAYKTYDSDRHLVFNSGLSIKPGPKYARDKKSCP